MRKARSLVKQEKVLSGLGQDLARLRHYKFHDGNNRTEARDSMEAMLHAIDCKEIGQAVIQLHEFSLVVNYDRSLRTESRLKEKGVKAKIFCFHEPIARNRQPDFFVRGRDFDWQVKPLAEFNKRVPVEVIRNLTYLRHSGINVDSIASATPVEHGSMKETAKDEIKKTADGFMRAIEGVLSDLSDPVLLVRFGPFYVEVGRWL